MKPKLTAPVRRGAAFFVHRCGEDMALADRLAGEGPAKQRNDYNAMRVWSRAWIRFAAGEAEPEAPAPSPDVTT